MLVAGDFEPVSQKPLLSISKNKTQPPLGAQAGEYPGKTGNASNGVTMAPLRRRCGTTTPPFHHKGHEGAPREFRGLGFRFGVSTTTSCAAPTAGLNSFCDWRSQRSHAGLPLYHRPVRGFRPKLPS
jgi:hypothetical protein